MRKQIVVAAVIGAMALVACQKKAADVWFKGDFQAAMNAAPQHGDLIMVEFYSDT